MSSPTGGFRILVHLHCRACKTRRSKAHSQLDRYARQILQTIERDGFYVRVPAGKEFTSPHPDP
jgi:hypothetical protein